MQKKVMPEEDEPLLSIYKEQSSARRRWRAKDETILQSTSSFAGQSTLCCFHCPRSF